MKTVEELIEEVSDRGGKLFARQDLEYIVVVIFPIPKLWNRYGINTSTWQVWVELWDIDRKVKDHQELLGEEPMEEDSLQLVLQHILDKFSIEEEKRLVAAYG